MAQAPCSVAITRFNVLHSLKIKFKKQAVAKEKTMSDQTLHKKLSEHAYTCYKKFYQPREMWFQEQRKHAQSLRQSNHLGVLLKIKYEQDCENSKYKNTIYSNSQPISTSTSEKTVYEYDPDSYDGHSVPSGSEINTEEKYSDEFEALSQGITSTQTSSFDHN